MRRVTMEQVQKLVQDFNNEIPKQVWQQHQAVSVIDLSIDNGKYSGNRYVVATRMGASRIRVTSLLQCERVLLNLLWAYRDGVRVGKQQQNQSGDEAP